MTVTQKIQSLLTAANTTTGEADTNLTDAVALLIDGYGGGGGGLRTATGTYTLASAKSSWDAQTHNLGTDKIMLIWYLESGVMKPNTYNSPLGWMFPALDLFGDGYYQKSSAAGDPLYLNSNRYWLRYFQIGAASSTELSIQAYGTSLTAITSTTFTLANSQRQFGAGTWHWIAIDMRDLNIPYVAR